jgi:ABC-2 type transport system permease protein
MKAFDIAVKDMTRSFRSTFALVFMFGVPLLLTGMFYFMFGGTGKSNQGFSVPVTKVVVANLDEGGATFNATAANLPAGMQSASSMGDIVVSVLQEKGFADLLEVSLANSAEAARSMVDTQQVGVAIIIPANFSESFSAPSGQTVNELYKDPTLTLGPSIVQSIMAQFMDEMSAAKVAVDVVTRQTGSSDPSLIGQVVSQYMAGSQNGDQGMALLDTRSPVAAKAQSNPVSLIISYIMGGMTIFYAFFTGTSTAQTILHEQETGTLARLFTTPTSQSTILGGKFLAVGLTVGVQMTVLLILGRLIFNIQWGSLLPLAIVTAGTVLAASTFGIFVMSLLKNTKQSGAVLGGVLTATGMAGMIKIFTMGSGSSPAWADVVVLVVPQGWGVRGLTQVMAGAPMNDVLLTFVALAVMSAVFFGIGLVRFQKRFA